MENNTLEFQRWSKEGYFNDHYGDIPKDDDFYTKRKCDTCKEELWDYCIEPLNYHDYDVDPLTFNNTFEFIILISGNEDGYILVCQECFNKHFKDKGLFLDNL